MNWIIAFGSGLRWFCTERSRSCASLSSIPLLPSLCLCLTCFRAYFTCLFYFYFYVLFFLRHPSTCSMRSWRSLAQLICVIPRGFESLVWFGLRCECSMIRTCLFLGGFDSRSKNSIFDGSQELEEEPQLQWMRISK